MHIQVHTQGIEAYWSLVKKHFKRKGGVRLHNMQNHLNEINWILQQDEGDLADSLMTLIRIYNMDQE